MPYYNTNKLEGEQLARAWMDAGTQQEAIFQLFKSRGRKGLSPSDVWELTGMQWPLTSVRRAMTDLTRDCKLLKTDRRKSGYYGKPEHIWMLHPRMDSVSPTLF